MKRPGRVLIVDDEGEWQDLVTRLLQNEGYLTDSVCSLDEAIERISLSLYHLVVLDIKMERDDSGIQLLQVLDKRGLSSAIDVVMLTGNASVQYAIESLSRYRAKGFFEK